MTEEEIKTEADAIASEIMDLLNRRGGKLPAGIVRVIPLGVAACIFTAVGISRDKAVDALNSAFDDLGVD